MWQQIWTLSFFIMGSSCLVLEYCCYQMQYNKVEGSKQPRCTRGCGGTPAADSGGIAGSVTIDTHVECPGGVVR